MMRILLSIALTFALSTSIMAEVAEWTQNQPLTVYLDPSIPQRDHRPRLVYFPSTEIGFVQDWAKEDLEVLVVGNGVQMMLKNPEFRTTIHVLGADGAIYPLRVARNPDDDPVSAVLQVVARKAANEGVATQGTRAPHDLDGEVLAMMRHMIGGDNHPWISSAADGEIRDNKFQPGRRIYESDHLSIYSFHTYRGMQTIGYQTVLHYKGTDPVQLNFQRLYFPQALAVYTPKQILMDPKSPGTHLEPGEKVILWFVARAGEGQ